MIKCGLQEKWLLIRCVMRNARLQDTQRPCRLKLPEREGTRMHGRFGQNTSQRKQYRKPKFPLVLPALLLTAVAPLQAQDRSWKDYLGGPASAHYSNLKQINPGNVKDLDVAWTYPTGDDITYTFSPLVIDNIAYFAAKQGSLVAVDAATGKELWVHPFNAGTGMAARFAGI